MNRKQLRARKALERKHALKIAWKHASTCYDLDSEGNYVSVSDPLAVKTFFTVFHKHLLGKDAITYKQLKDEQSSAFLSSGNLAPNTVSLIKLNNLSQKYLRDFRFYHQCSLFGHHHLHHAEFLRFSSRSQRHFFYKPYNCRNFIVGE